MTELGGQLDGREVVEGEQPMRPVGEESLRRIGAEPANVPAAVAESPEHAACDGLTDVVRGAVGLPEMEGEGGELDLFGMSDAEFGALVAGMNHEPDVLPEPQAMELLEALRSANDSDAGQAAA